MKKLVIAFLVFGIAATSVRSFGAGNAPEPPKIQEMYCKFVKFDTKKTAKFLMIMYVMAPTTGGPNITFYKPSVQVEGNTKKVLELSQQEKDTLSGYKPGQIFKVYYDIQNTNMYVAQHLEPYQPRAGEEDPGVFIFTGQGNLKGWPTVDTTKLTAPMRFIVPVKAIKGKNEPDPAIIEKIKKFKANDLVEIQVVAPAATPIIKSIKAWEPPTMAEMGKIVKSETGFNTVDVTGISESKTLTFRRTAGSLLAKARQIKPGKSILYRATPDEKDKSILWIDDLRLTPENYVAPETPAAATDDAAGVEKDGTFVAAGKTKAPVSGEELDFIEIKEPAGDSAFTSTKYLISTKDAARVLPKAKDIKDGTPVTFKFTNDLQGKWLVDIKVKTAEKPATKPAGDDTKKPAKPEKTEKTDSE